MEVKVLDTNFDVVGLVESADSFYWVDRFNSPGEFEIFTEVSSELINLLQHDRYLQIPESNKTMIVESLIIRPDIEKGNKLIVRGRSLESILDRRIVWTQTLIDSDVETGLFEILDDAFITGVSNPNRILSNFVLVPSYDTGITDLTMQTQFDAENILDVVNTVCQNSDIGYKITLNSDLEFEFTMFRGIDRSFSQTFFAHVVFSPKFDNLANSEFITSKRNYKNNALWVGDESGTSSLVRGVMFTGSGGSATGLDRREVYLDQGQYSRFIQGTSTPIDALDYTAQMQEISRRSLYNDYPIYNAFSGNADTTHSVVYGTDFFLGDILQIENEYGMTARTRVVEMIFSEDGSGIHNYPTFDQVD